MVEHRIHRFFARAREQFFPDWDAKRDWEIVAGRRKHCDGETGYCSLRKRHIYIDPSGVIAMLDDGLFALIIHEICHAVQKG